MGKKKILVVDDELSNRKVFQEILIHFGYYPMICQDAEQAMKEISKADLILTDFEIPGMNGAELCAIAKKQRPNLPVVIITGKPWMVPDGIADKVIEKPPNIMELNEAINTLLLLQ